MSSVPGVKMHAITGRYFPAEKRFGDWAFRTIHHKVDRASIADCVRIIRGLHGNAEAQAFINYLSWLGTLPASPARMRRYVSGAVRSTIEKGRGL